MRRRRTAQSANPQQASECTRRRTKRTSNPQLRCWLTEYADQSVDIVILNQTLQQVKKPDFAIKEALRVGKKVIVGFPNFCYITDRFQIFFRGKVPVTSSLPYEWYDTPNLHFLSIADFKDYCKKSEICIEKAVFISKDKEVSVLPNLFGEVGLFLLSK
jgi:methionine biosynthesis protein MetW